MSEKRQIAIRNRATVFAGGADIVKSGLKLLVVCWDVTLVRFINDI